MSKFDKSELSQEAFCEAHGLTLGTFRSWLYRLRREGESATPTFVEVSIANKSASSQACVVIIGKSPVGPVLRA